MQPQSAFPSDHDNNPFARKGPVSQPSEGYHRLISQTNLSNEYHPRRRAAPPRSSRILALRHGSLREQLALFDRSALSKVEKLDLRAQSAKHRGLLSHLPGGPHPRIKDNKQHTEIGLKALSRADLPPGGAGVHMPSQSQAVIRAGDRERHGDRVTLRWKS